MIPGFSRASGSVVEEAAVGLWRLSTAPKGYLTGDQNRVEHMHARTRLIFVVEIEVWVAGTDAARVKPQYAAVAEEHILTPAAMVRAVAFTNREKVFMIRLIGKYRYP
jgi:hypothetical protein